MRTLPNTGLEAPEHGDSSFWETFDDLVDGFDELTVLRGDIANRPPASDPTRLYLSVDEDPPTLYYDTGDEWVSPATYGNPPDALLRRDEDEAVEAAWNFHETLHAHISGHAETATEAGTAERADDADRLGGDPADAYARADREEEVEAEWTFDEIVTLEEGARVNGGTIDQPQYSGGDPQSFRLGSMWVRTDRQP